MTLLFLPWIWIVCSIKYLNLISTSFSHRTRAECDNSTPARRILLVKNGCTPCCTHNNTTQATTKTRIPEPMWPTPAAFYGAVRQGTKRIPNETSQNPETCPRSHCVATLQRPATRTIHSISAHTHTHTVVKITNTISIHFILLDSHNRCELSELGCFAIRCQRTRPIGAEGSRQHPQAACRRLQHILASDRERVNHGPNNGTHNCLGLGTAGAGPSIRETISGNCRHVPPAHLFQQDRSQCSAFAGVQFVPKGIVSAGPTREGKLKRCSGED